MEAIKKVFIVNGRESFPVKGSATPTMEICNAIMGSIEDESEPSAVEVVVAKVRKNHALYYSHRYERWCIFNVVLQRQVYDTHSYSEAKRYIDEG